VQVVVRSLTITYRIRCHSPQQRTCIHESRRHRPTWFVHERTNPLRCKITFLSGYWDDVVDSPPERREWLQSRGLWKEPHNKRWWGTFTNWLSKMTTVGIDFDPSLGWV
jgi:hypothetical protein